VPFLVGFAIPAGHLVNEAVERLRFAPPSDRLLREALNTLTISALATFAVLAAGMLLVFTSRNFPNRSVLALQRLSTIGYAMPGTVLALGILIVTGGLDQFIDRTAQEWLGVSTGLLLIGSGLALGYAYLVRFLAISVGSIEAGMSRFPRSFDHAARSLGHGRGGVFWRLHLPLSRTALAAAGLLVFVDCMKELSATLLLRPLNLETLATHVYGEAARGTYEEAALAALLIVAVGVLPVVFLARLGRRGLSMPGPDSDRHAG
jgi:iron(III) transport system permease protein